MCVALSFIIIMRKSLTFLPLLLSVSAAIGLISSVLAQGELDDKRITSITVKYNGPETVAKQRILDNMSSKVGQVFSVDKIDDDIKNLVSKGLVVTEITRWCWVYK